MSVIKLLIVRTGRGKGKGGIVVTAIVDLSKETISYYEPIIELTGAKIINLLKLVPNRTEVVDVSNVDFQYLREELKIGLMKNVEGYELKDIQEDYVILEKDNLLELVYREDNAATICLDSTLHRMVRELVLSVVGCGITLENQCTVVNKYKEPYDEYIGRGSKWGNPFPMKDNSQAERDRVCDLYEEWFDKTGLKNHLHELRGKKLGCFCKPKRCHGDYLAKRVNESQAYEVIPKP